MFEAFKRYQLRMKRKHCTAILLREPERIVVFGQFMEDFKKWKTETVSDHFLMTQKLQSCFSSAGHCLTTLATCQQAIVKEQRLPPDLPGHRAKSQRYLDEWLDDWSVPDFHQRLTEHAIALSSQLITSRGRGDQLYHYYQRKLNGYYLELLELSDVLLEAR